MALLDDRAVQRTGMALLDDRADLRTGINPSCTAHQLAGFTQVMLMLRHDEDLVGSRCHRHAGMRSHFVGIHACEHGRCLPVHVHVCICFNPFPCIPSTAHCLIEFHR